MTRKPLALVALAVLLAGCGPKSELDLDLRSVSITVPKLVTPAVALVPPATTPQPVALPELPPLAPLAPVTPSLPPVVPPAKPPASCPRAGQFDVPEKTGYPLLEAPPAPGRYLQTTEGSYLSATGGGSLSGVTDVVVKALPSTTSAVGQKVDAWEVTRTSARTGTTVERYQLVHPSSSSVGTPSGIYLVGLAWKDGIRKDVTFQPVGGGLLVLPNPVVLAANAAQYTGAATDPDTLTTLALIRNVTGKKRVDVCGKLVDTYTVAMQGVLTSPDAQYQVGWTQQLATAYGSADVEDSMSLTTVDGSFTWSRSLRSTALPKDPA